jgi:hypothetical protein
LHGRHSKPRIDVARLLWVDRAAAYDVLFGAGLTPNGQTVFCAPVAVELGERFELAAFGASFHGSFASFCESLAASRNCTVVGAVLIDEKLPASAQATRPYEAIGNRYNHFARRVRGFREGVDFTNSC